MRKIIMSIFLIGLVLNCYAQFSIRRNSTDPTAVDILYTPPPTGIGTHPITLFEFGLQAPNPEGAQMTAVFTPGPALSALSFDAYTGTDYGNQTWAWAPTPSVPTYSNTYDFDGSEVVLGTVTFSAVDPSILDGVIVSAIDYQNQPQYGGSTNVASWALDIDASMTDMTEYSNLFYQSSGSNVPYTTNDGGVINQKVDIIPGAPLPITLSDFTAQLNDKHTVDLDWVTQTEINSKGFDIERSSNGRDFQKIGYVSSKTTDGNSTAKLVYASEDLNPVTGDNYYRLKEISMDGKATYSVVRKVTVGSDQLISLYPNPANSFVNIKGLQAGNVIRVYDMAGKMILEKKAAESQLMQIDVSGIANGNYQVAVFSNDSRVFTGKLVKND